MARQIFVNLPVRDLGRSVQFMAALGFGLEPRFTDHSAACVVIDEHIAVMLLTHAKFKEFAPHPIGDARNRTDVLLCLSCGSREEVDDLANRAVEAGGSTFKEPSDYGFMYGQSFQDPDGHVWELLWMDAAAFDQARAGAA